MLILSFRSTCYFLAAFVLAYFSTGAHSCVAAEVCSAVVCKLFHALHLQYDTICALQRLDVMVAATLIYPFFSLLFYAATLWQLNSFIFLFNADGPSEVRQGGE
jgi:hypothetical protein